MNNFGEFFNDQIENASTIILSRSQKLSDNELNICVKEIKGHNNKANIITTSWNELNGKQILSAIEDINFLEKELLKQERLDEHKCHCNHHNEHGHELHECNCHHHHYHQHADDVFVAWGTETPKKYNHSELDSILKKLTQSEEYGEILRAKGIVQDINGKWINFDLVSEEYEIRYGNTDYTGRICVIGSKLNKNKLEKLFS